MFTTSTKILGQSLGTPEAIYAWAAKKGANRLPDLKLYLETVYKLCQSTGIAAHVLVAQSCHETADPDSGIPWKSYWYTQRLNVAGIGITGDTAQNNASRTFADGAAAARAHALHMYLYAIGTSIPTGLSKSDDPRWQAAVDAGYAGIATTIADLTNRWGIDNGYAAGVAKWLNVLDAAGLLTASTGTTTTKPPTSSTGGSPVVTNPIEQAYTAWNVPGGKRPLLLPSWIKVVIRPVDLARVRSYEKWAKSMTTVHDTGNERTNAQAEYEWLAAGRPGGEVGGYEWINDDSGIIITGWFDETTWAQGVQDGNRRSHAGELAWGGNVVWTTALEICCAMHGAVLEMEDKISDAAAVLHQWWTGKWCAGQILNRGIWPEVLAKILSYAKAARAFRQGQPVTDLPTTTYPQTYVPLDPATGEAWDGLADIVVNGVRFEAQKVTAKTTGELNQRQWASTDSLFTGPVIPAGTSVDLLGWVAGELVDGISEWWVRNDGVRLWAGGIDVEPKVDPDYGQQPEPPTGGVDLPAQGPVPVNGRLYYPLFDEASEGEGKPVLGRKITIERPGNLYKWADTTTPVVGTVTPAVEGQPAVEHVFRYWTRGEELPLTMKNAAGEMVTVGEPIWYAEDLYEGARMWSGLSTERPD